MSDAAVELTQAQGDALAAMDEHIAAIGESFDGLIAATKQAEEAGVPQPILMAKAGAIQQTIMQKMMAAG